MTRSIFQEQVPSSLLEPIHLPLDEAHASQIQAGRIRCPLFSSKPSCPPDLLIPVKHTIPCFSLQGKTLELSLSLSPAFQICILLVARTYSFFLLNVPLIFPFCIRQDSLQKQNQVGMVAGMEVMREFPLTTADLATTSAECPIC